MIAHAQTAVLLATAQKFDDRGLAVVAPLGEVDIAYVIDPGHERSGCSRRKASRRTVREARTLGGRVASAEPSPERIDRGGCRLERLGGFHATAVDVQQRLDPAGRNPEVVRGSE